MSSLATQNTMQKTLLLTARLGALVALLGCSAGARDQGHGAEGGAALVRDTAAPVQTDSLAYTLRVESGGIALATEIGFTYRNALPDTIYVVNCRGGLAMSLERLEDGEWRTYWEPVLLMCLSPPLTIPPGSTFRGTMPVIGVLPGHDAGPEFGSAQPEGTYRLRWRNLVLHYDERGQGFGEPVTEELTYSNAFMLLDPRE